MPQKSSAKIAKSLNLLYIQAVIFILVLLVLLGVKFILPDTYNLVKIELLKVTAEKTTVDPIIDAKATQKPIEYVSDYDVGGEDEPTAKYVFDLGNVRQMSTDSNRLTQMCMPLIPKRISSPFGYRVNPVTGNYGIHGGLDMSADTGTKISAVLPGTVLKAKYSADYGNFVTIDHGDGLITLYAHCSKLLVGVGDVVKQGDIVALVGNTGRSTGPHLHFEVRINDVRINPQYFLSGLNEA